MEKAFADSEVYLLHELTTRLDQIARVTAFEPHGLTQAEFMLMLAVREAPNQSQDSITAWLHSSKSLVSQRVTALVKKGYVAQVRQTADRRLVNLGLTPAGESLLNQVYAELTAAADRLFGALGPDRGPFQTTLLQLVETLRHLKRPD